MAKQEMTRPLDRQSFELLFKNEFKGLVVFSMQYVKDYEAAREVVQEAFANLWHRKEQIDLSRPVRSYLSSSVRNRSLNWIRDRKKFGAGQPDLEEMLYESSYVPADRLVVAELSERIRAAIDELPDRCREVFLLNRDRHLKYQEIADMLQISVKTVETQMSKALKHLRDRLRDYLVVLLLLMLSHFFNQGISSLMCIITG